MIDILKKGFTIVVKQKKPQGIFSFRYFLPFQNDFISLHRKFWLMSLASPAKIIINTIGFAKWSFFYSWKRCFRVIKLNKKFIEEKKETKLRLFFKLMSLALFNNIDIHNYFNFKMYKPFRAKPWLYIFNSEIPYFHDYKNRDFNKESAIKLINNKDKFSKILKENNISGINTISVTNENNWDNSYFFQKRDVFCKPVSASQSLNAFHIKYENKTENYSLYPINGNSLYTIDEMNKYLGEIKKSTPDMLIQEYITNHPEIDRLSYSKEVTTFRVITFKNKNKKANILYLQIEIPKPQKDEKTGKQCYDVYPLDLILLIIHPGFSKHNSYETINLNFSKELKKLIFSGIKQCLKVHSNILDIYTVAFDIIISIEKAVIVEANYNWSLYSLYTITPDDYFISNKPNILDKVLKPFHK